MYKPPGITEEEIISKCKHGSLKHQELLYKQFYGYAMGVALRYVFNRDDAVEAVNDAFIKIFKTIETFREGNAFRAWLHTITVNAAIDKRRKELKHQANTNLETAMALSGHSTVIEELTARDIISLFKQLPLMHSTVFNLYEMDGYSHDEIAKILGIPVSSSRVYLTRAKEKMKKLLTAEAQRYEK